MDACFSLKCQLPPHSDRSGDVWMIPGTKLRNTLSRSKVLRQFVGNCVNCPQIGTQAEGLHPVHKSYDGYTLFFPPGFYG